MLKFRLGKTLANITLAPGFEAVVFKVIGDAEKKGYTRTLINAALESNRDNPELLAFVQGLGLVSVTKTLEREIEKALPTLQISPWRSKLGLIEGRVCRVEI